MFRNIVWVLVRYIKEKDTLLMIHLKDKNCKNHSSRGISINCLTVVSLCVNALCSVDHLMFKFVCQTKHFNRISLFCLVKQNQSLYLFFSVLVFIGSCWRTRLSEVFLKNYFKMKFWNICPNSRKRLVKKFSIFSYFFFKDYFQNRSTKFSLKKILC